MEIDQHRIILQYHKKQYVYCHSETLLHVNLELRTKDFSPHLKRKSLLNIGIPALSFENDVNLKVPKRILTWKTRKQFTFLFLFPRKQFIFKKLVQYRMCYSYPLIVTLYGYLKDLAQYQSLTDFMRWLRKNDWAMSLR